MNSDITLQGVKDACRWFDGDAWADQSAYKRASQFDWKRIDEADESDLMREGGPIWFLDRWRAFNIRSMWPNQLDPNLSRYLKFAHRNAREAIDGLDDVSIVDVDLSNEEISGKISKSFYSLSTVGTRFKHVAASKYLHMRNPKLFVMWDTSIATYGYGIGGFSDLANHQATAASEYVGTFLPAVQERLRTLLTEVVSDCGCEPSDAPQRLKAMVSDSHSVGKTCAKVIDEFNYRTYTRK
jgi:hypothetical protein